MLSEPQVTESQVTESVERYFSEPQFSGFYTQREVRIQIGSSARRADIALYTDSNSPQMIVIIECKWEGITRIQQLHSYLSASATELGIFANTDDPNEWYYVRNLGGNQFDDITRADFENRLEELSPIPELQQRRDLMNDTKRRARTATVFLSLIIIICRPLRNNISPM